MSSAREDISGDDGDTWDSSKELVLRRQGMGKTQWTCRADGVETVTHNLGRMHRLGRSSPRNP